MEDMWTCTHVHVHVCYHSVVTCFSIILYFVFLSLSSFLPLFLPFSLSLSLYLFFFLFFSQVKKDAMGKSRGFGFVRFSDADIQRKVYGMRHAIKDRRVELRVPRQVRSIVVTCFDIYSL